MTLRRVFKFLGLALLALLLVLLALLGYALGTEQGLRQLIKLGTRAVPGTLQVAATGHLLGDLDLRDLRYRAAGLELDVGHVQLRWQPGQLFARRLQVERLAIEGVRVELPPSPEKPTEPKRPITLPDVRLPVALELREVEIRDVRIHPHGGAQPVILERARLVADTAGDAVHLKELTFKTPEASARLTGRVTPVGRYPLDLELGWTYTHDRLGEQRGIGTIRGDLDKLTLHHDVQGLAVARLDGTVSDVLSKPGWDARIDAQAANLGALGPALDGAPLRAELSSQGTLEGFQASGQVTTDLRQTGPVRVDLALAGDLRKLRLEEIATTLLDRPGRLVVRGDVDLADLRVDVAGDWQSLTWPLVGKAEYESPRGTLRASGTPRDYQATLEAQLAGEPIGELQARVAASGSDRLVTLSELSLRAPKGPLGLQATGEFDLAEQRFDAKAQWQALAWPVTASAPQVRSPRGQINVSGLLSDYRFSVEADAEGLNIPKGSWRLDGQGSTEALSAFTLVGRVLEGELRAEGDAAWKPAVRWQASLSGRGLNPGAHWSDLPGKLALALKSDGQVTEAGPRVSLDLADLSGQLRGQALRGRGQIDVLRQDLTVRALQLAAGSARLDADGRLSEQLDLRWKLDAPDLGRVVPNASGRIRGAGTLGGTRAAPLLDLEVGAQDVRLGKTRIKRLQGEASLDISGARASKLELAGDGLQLAGQDWRKLSLDGNGTPAGHELRAALDGDAGQFQLALRGGMAGEQWRGQLGELTARKTLLGDWALERPVELTAAKDAASAGEACLASAPSRLCLQGNWSAPAGARGALTLEQFALERLREFLPEGLKIESVLSGTASGFAPTGGQPQGEARFTLAPGKLLLTTDGKPVPMDIAGGSLQARTDGGNADARLDLDLGNAGRLDAATRLVGLDREPTLDGAIKAQLSDLALISAFAPQLQAVKGRFDADLKLAGKLAAPAVIGSVRLADFSAEVPQVEIKLEDTQLKVESDGRGPLRLSGSARSGPGNLELDGALDPATRALTLTIRGQEFQAAGSRTMQALLSPDLRVAMDAKGMRVDGEVRIPKAYINAKGAGGEGSAVTVSPDVVIVESDGQTEPKPKAGNLNLNLRIVLGDDVKVETGDFRGALKGNLLVEQSPQLPPRGTGTIEVVNGDYVVYGQQLNMQRGRILFSGGPIDNPQLDMDVARRIEAYDVLAVARIRGTAKAPLVQLYSRPSMPDAHILSYIILGQPPGTKGASYTLGRYLTPDLYVSYGIGLFNAINTFNLRYKLTDRLSLQAASGAASSADLIYSIER